MRLFLPLSRAWVQAVFRPTALAWVGLLGVALVALVSQILIRIPVIPGPTGIGAVAVGLLPEVGAMMLPVALFIGTLTAARGWESRGDLAALYAMGLGTRCLLPGALAIGLVGCCLVGLLTHQLAPAGRTMAREALIQAGGELRLEAARPTWVGDTLVRAGGVRDGVLTDLFVAQDDVVAFAPHGQVGGEGTMLLRDGMAKRLGPAGWSMRFETLQIPLRVPPPRVHSFDMSNERLRALIGRMQQSGRSAHAERLVLLKRTTLALGTPLLVLFALPLGARSRWPLATAVLSILVLWGVQRVGDHLAAGLGPEAAAGLPMLVLLAGTAWAWLGWRQR